MVFEARMKIGTGMVLNLLDIKGTIDLFAVILILFAGLRFGLGVQVGWDM